MLALLFGLLDGTHVVDGAGHTARDPKMTDRLISVLDDLDLAPPKAAKPVLKGLKK